MPRTLMVRLYDFDMQLDYIHHLTTDKPDRFTPCEGSH